MLQCAMHSMYCIYVLTCIMGMHVRTVRVSNLLELNMVCICQRDSWCPQHNMLIVYIRTYVRTLTREYCVPRSCKEPLATFNEFY